MSGTRDSNDLDDLSIEDEVNSRRGYGSIVHNPKMSTQAKHHAIDIVHDELGGDLPRHRLGQPPASRDYDKDRENRESERTKRDSDKDDQSKDVLLEHGQREQYPG